LEGIFVPFCILAVTGLEIVRMRIIVPRFRRSARTIWRELVAAILLVTLPTFGTLLVSNWWVSAGPSPDLRLYHSNAEIAAMDWLNVNARAGAVVLSDFRTGNYLPARTSLIAFIGHGPETLNLNVKQPMAESFLAGTLSAGEERFLLESNGIEYVIYGPANQPARDPNAALPTLTKVYDIDGYRIYQYHKGS